MLIWRRGLSRRSRAFTRRCRRTVWQFEGVYIYIYLHSFTMKPLLTSDKAVAIGLQRYESLEPKVT
jgi:hypothetical protein